ncbi:MAG: hypothetical protein GVY13_17155 [Alphaproteobacteria bacterium]|jgi:tetratricopeptide (TPR) repeat protein|nr:hypothetical protein [Alphaproteobacteria bacterium]
MSSLGYAQVDQFVFTPCDTPEIRVLLLRDEDARPIIGKFFKEFSPHKAIIGTNEKLSSLHAEIHKRIRYEKPARKIGNYVNTVLNAASLTETGFSWSLGGLLNHQNPAAAVVTLPRLLLIYEDDLSVENLSSFFSLFKQVDSETRPAIIFIARSDIPSAATKLAACGDEIAVLTLAPSGIQELPVSAVGSAELHEFLKLFIAEADGTCIATDRDRLKFTGNNRGALTSIAVEMLKIQSLFRVGRKFDAKAKIENVEKELAMLSEFKETSIDRELLYIRGLLDLWYVYVTEDCISRIQNAVSIADRLKDELLLAHALKQVPMLHGYGELARQHLMRAKNIFLSHAETEHALFVDNNAVVNDLYTVDDCSPQATRMSNYIVEFCPYIRRSTTFHSNAGISCLITGQTAKALEFFERAVAGSGPAVNKLTSEINRFIARYIDGEEIDKEEAYRFLRKLERSNVPKGFDYHQTVMLANLWKIFHTDLSVASEILNVLRGKQFLPYDKFLDSPDRLIRFSLSYMQAVSKTARGNPPGRLGAFFEQHGLWLSAHVFYR